jgi:hypothetical protein
LPGRERIIPLWAPCFSWAKLPFIHSFIHVVPADYHLCMERKMGQKSLLRLISSQELVVSKLAL